MADGTPRPVTEADFETAAAFASIDNRVNTTPAEKNPASSTVFYKAVVVDFLSNPVEDLNRVDSNGVTQRSYLNRTLKPDSKSWIDRMPRNSIIGWRSGEDGSPEVAQEIFYPFFSPHLCLPVKSGEKVWVVYERAGNTNTSDNPGYWISRVVGDVDIDDLNYTHVDRRTSNVEQNQNPNTDPKIAYNQDNTEGEAPSNTLNPLGFPPGGVQERSRNTIPDVEGKTGYEEIITFSDSYNKQYTPEPIPRFSKRSPDLSLQGSNNTLITLGEDRGRIPGNLFSSSTPDDQDLTNTIGVNNKFKEDKKFLGKGTIDIVAGRSVLLNDGTFLYDKIPEKESTSVIVSSDENPTAPAAVAKNTRSLGEIDKNPVVTRGNEAGPNINEGDPDFINDLSRIYVSMKTDGDRNFGLVYPSLDDGEVEAVNEDAYVILKSNQIRVIAKYSEDQAVNGSIKIIKEGVEDDEGGVGRAVIIMQPDGTIMIDGPKIIIGSGIDKANGAGEQIYLGRDAKESIVLGDKLNSLLLDLLNEMLTAAPSYVATAVGPGVLHPAVVTAITTLIGELKAKSNLSTIGKTK